MVRAGISLPALQHLMGHSQIQTTMLYVELAPQDVWREYAQGCRQAYAHARYLSENAMKHSRHTLEQIFQTQVNNLSLTLQPFTIEFSTADRLVAQISG